MADTLAMSPFKIPLEDEELLCGHEGFRVLRDYLARDADFCSTHIHSDPATQAKWLLHRDLLHALVMPVVSLFKRASALAEAALCTRNTEDLELAFSGVARGAFLCLQCFVEEEEDWCRTIGCPACVTTATLSTESHIRLTIAASLLSTSPVSTPNSSNASTPTDEHPSPSKSLPPLPHILPALRDALSSDPFWGPDHWTHMFARADQLSADIQELIAECIDLESLVSSPRPTSYSSAGPRRVGTAPALLLQRMAHGEEEERKGAKVRVSQMAKRQMKLRDEEMEMVRRCAMQCWARTAVPSRIRGELLGMRDGEKRRRNLSCP
ncbi:hypothetical protein K504DRAFT_410746 [Pleomassaria siparia CBS 279.74]|uniref:Uncharacterized protein n=1 Tax=Pleomassaria siparia CBS 279.74 TaxID=1314801 RepID=A0A6G1K608_9PLEO|nr:hypothetical protein K504DRAFT_410746 [Pleomassaria siparia CBS 279.74]